MRQPPGFEDSVRSTHVCKLKKVIYGLKQAPRTWYNELKNFLLTIGFIKFKSDSSLFILQKSGLTIYTLIYVDDIIVIGNQQYGVQQMINLSSKRFPLKDLGPLHYFLGIEVIPSSNGLLLSQQKYIKDLLSDADMQNCKGVPTPMTSSTTLTATTTEDPAGGTLFRRVIGKLHYLSFTRSDIAFTVSKLS